VGHAALKVGDSTFARMALEAAKSRVAGGGPGPGSVGGTPKGRVGGYGHARSSSRAGEARIRSGSSGEGGGFLSRSALDNVHGMAIDHDSRVIMTTDRERRHSNVSSSASSSVPPIPQVHLAMVAPHMRSVMENGHCQCGAFGGCSA